MIIIIRPLNNKTPTFKRLKNKPMKTLKLSIIALIINSAFLIFNSPKAEAQIIITVAGNEAPGYSGDGGYATTAQLNYPMGVAFDAAGNMYIADESNQRIRKVTPSGIIT